MLRKNAFVSLAMLLSPMVVKASGEIPLFWDTITITSPARGGAVLAASLTEERQLDEISFKVRDKALDIPERCLEGLHNPYLNGLNMSYGQFRSGQEYWTINIPFDGTDSVEFAAEFRLIFSDAKLLWSYMTIQIDRATWEDTDVCPLQGATP